MQYGSLEWANDLLNSTKAELDKINAADDKGKAAAAELGITEYYTNLIKALEDEIAKGNYAPEAKMLAKDTSDDEDFDDDNDNVVEDLKRLSKYDDYKNGFWNYLSKYEGDPNHYVDYATDWWNDNAPKEVVDALQAENDGKTTPEQEKIIQAWENLFNEGYNKFAPGNKENDDNNDVTQNLIKGIKFGQYDK